MANEGNVSWKDNYMTCGIYIIKNTINDKVYVGQSVDIEHRFYAHKYSAMNRRQDSHTQIHRAMKTIGVENFYYEILEECPIESLDEREIYYIDKFDSYVNGYNMTLGGEGNAHETNGRAILTLPQVIEIRMMYGNKIPFREAYKRYEGVISKRGFKKVWRYETWLGIMPEVYSDENLKWHSSFAKAYKDGNKQLGKNGTERACNQEEIERMRKLRAEGMTYEKISQEVHRSANVVRKYCLHREVKNPQANAKTQPTSIKVRNIETGLVFDSLKQAANWAGAKDTKTLSRIVKNKNESWCASGVVQSTGQPAHWEKI